MRSWRTSVVLSEASANAFASRRRLAVLALVIVGLTAGLIWAELVSWRQLAAAEERYAAAGGYVAVASGPSGIDAARCEDVGRHEAVAAAGSFRTAGQVASITAPRVVFARLNITAGLVGVWSPGVTAAASNVLIGDAAAGELGIVTGSWLTLSDGAVAPAQVIDTDARNPLIARSIMELVPAAGSAAECWVEFGPDQGEAGTRWLAAAFAADGATVRPAVERGAFASDPATAFAGRISGMGWIPASLVASGVIALFAVFRLSEIAVYRAFGLSRSGVLLLLQTEAAIVVAMAAVVASAWSVLGFALTTAVDLAGAVVALRSAALFVAATALTAPVIALFAAWGSPALLLKE